jgi:hypothetical protein
MKKLFCVPCLSAALALTLSLSPAVHAAIFTSNASISFDDTSLDGQDIVGVNAIPHTCRASRCASTSMTILFSAPARTTE